MTSPFLCPVNYFFVFNWITVAPVSNNFTRFKEFVIQRSAEKFSSPEQESFQKCYLGGIGIVSLDENALAPVSRRMASVYLMHIRTILIILYKFFT